MALVCHRRLVSLSQISTGLSMEENGSQVYTAGTAYQRSDITHAWWSASTECNEPSILFLLHVWSQLPQIALVLTNRSWACAAHPGLESWLKQTIQLQSIYLNAKYALHYIECRIYTDFGLMKLEHVLHNENYYSIHTLHQPCKMAYKIFSNHIKIVGKKVWRFSAFHICPFLTWYNK